MKDLQKNFDKEIIDIKQEKINDISSISNQVAMKKIGIYCLNIFFKDGCDEKTILKIKSKNILKNGINLLSKSNLKLKIGLLLNHKIFSYDNSCKREIQIYENIDNLLKNNMIKYYGSFIDSRENTYNLIFKYYDFKKEKLTFGIAKKILENITNFHVFYYNRKDLIKKMKLNNYSKKDYKRAMKNIKMIFDFNNEENIQYFGEVRTKKILNFIKNIDKYVSKYSYHKSFTHNDFSTRNIFYSNEKILFYDFELACYQNPEHDLIEFLIYELENFNKNEILELISFYKDTLLNKINVRIDKEEYKQILLFNTYEFIINRLSLLRLASKTIEINFIDKLLINSNKLLDILEENYE